MLVICRQVAEAKKINRKSLLLEQKLTGRTKAGKNHNQALINRMGVDPRTCWVAHCEVLPGKENVVAEPKNWHQRCDEFISQTDLDREGKRLRGI